MNGRRILFAGDRLKSAGGEVANAQVCKTCIRGFDSRPALQNFNAFYANQAQSNFRSVHMSDTESPTPRPRVSLDVYAVALALFLALLVRLNLIPPIKW